MRSLILIALLCTVLAAMLHSTDAQKPHKAEMPGMPGSSGFTTRARRAAQGGGGGGAGGGAGAGAGMGFGMGANMGAGGQAGGGGQG
ncbi:glycine-rich protein 5-like [Ceratitis capitata]|uniref:(Mediterranean fruit fly) hypothetical protein n=1 Tax=Ceratitis capitata TaxID=7213 RepID=A0A811V655_CERCA|nr:glycine-rich protein 5-like [Ceratitis capitata]CAD7005905.1 unnamed protein product [Ceratitis capitata]